MPSARLVTIILTTLNSERYLARSIRSCLAQTHSDLELLIVDGGSRDATLEIIADYQLRDPRIHVIHQLNNIGKLPGAINLGMENARGDYITWTQDDSWYELEAIAAMLQELQADPDSALVYTDYWIADEQARIIQYHTVSPPELKWFLVDDVVGQSFLFRRKIFEIIGPQDTRYFPVHEIPWRIKIAQQFKIRCLHVPLVYYTLHSESLTGRIGGWELQRMMARALVAEKVINRSTLRHHLGKIDINEAYEAFVIHGDYRKLWRLAAKGFVRNPRQIGNLGYLKLIARSALLPGRAKYRDRLYQEWVAKEQSALATMIERFLPDGPRVP